MMQVLKARLSSIESAIAERHRAARESGGVANVKALGSELREVKLQLAATRDAGGEAPGVCSVCGSNKWLTARWVRGDRTICGPCWKKAGKAGAPA